ncbi:MAG: DUF1631 family protein [Rubrivivax sp.]|nr:DUF1631 family protein [Rubrivivax sp.]
MSNTRPIAAPTAPRVEDLLQAAGARVVSWVGKAIDRAAEDQASPGRPPTSPPARDGAALLGALRGSRNDLVARIATAVRARLAGGEQGLPEETAAPAGSGDELQLRLIGEEQIDEEIETSRIVQLIEADAEIELQVLSALCSGLRQLDHVDPGATPLRPQVCALGLREGLAAMPIEPALRLALLRAIGGALGPQIRIEYTEQARLLAGWSVRPAPFRIRPTATAARVTVSHVRRADLGADADADLGADGRAAGGTGEPDAPGDALRKLVQWARATAPATSDVPGTPEEADGAHLPLRLLPEPGVRAAHEDRALARPDAERAMRQLFAQLGELGEVSPAGRQLVQGLNRAGERLSAQDPTLWSNPDHPWWQLIDRLLDLGAVHDDLDPRGQAQLHDSLRRVVSRFQDEPQIDARALHTAADDVRAVATRLLEGEARALLGQVGDLQRDADREELEVAMRSQVEQQLRCTSVCGALRRFLVGPWTLAMVGAALKHGQSSEQLARLALVVDDLIRATAQPGRPVSAPQRAVLLRQIANGLAQAELAPRHIETEVAELIAVLRDPPPPEDAGVTWEEPAETMPASMAMELHAGLPTVPLDIGTVDTAAGPAAWVDGLQAGCRCRLFLEGTWLTARLRWASPTRNLFVFSSRHGRRSHSLTRRMLQKLRHAGLATRVENGMLLAQAIDTLTADTLG